MDISNEQLCEDLVALIGRVKAAMARLAEKYDLTAMQLHALHAILNGDTTMGKVAVTLRCDASNVTGIVDRLVAGRLITRQEGLTDRRTKTLELTTAGRDAIDDIYSKLPGELGCERLNAHQRDELHDVMSVLLSDAGAKAAARAASA